MSLTASNISPAGDDTMYMPLESLINKLKQNGFSIRPDDYIEILKVIERFQPATLQEAGRLICPLIVNSEEEQVRFGIVFRKICEEKEEIIDGGGSGAWWKKFREFVKKKRRYLLWAIGVLVATAIIFFLFRNFSAKSASSSIPAITLTLNNADGRFFRAGDTVMASVKFTPGADTNRMYWEWNTGNGWSDRNKETAQVYSAEKGVYDVGFRLLTRNDDNTIVIDSSIGYRVCEKLPEPVIVFNSSEVNITDTLIASVDLSKDDLARYKTSWAINEKTVATNTSVLKYPADSVGTQGIRFIVRSPDDPQCDYNDINFFTVRDPNEKTYQLNTTPTGSVVSVPKKIKNWILGTLGISFLISLVARYILKILDKRKKKRAKDILDSAITMPAQSPSRKPPYEIPMENRQHQLVASEQSMNEVMRFMHQRTRDEALALNIPQTVQNTIRTGGIPDLVYSNKLRPNDYLVVIDSRVANSQQLKLFDYLVGTFRNENMSVVHFHYKDDFSTFYNKQYPAGLTLKRLTELYKEFTLIIYGTAHHLIYDAYPAINADRFNELADWENKAILTPIPYQDWSIKEKLIAQQMILLPADAEGQLRLIKAINEKLLRHNDYLSSAENFYSTAFYDFADIADIREYLDDEDLFQWICAIAIYPGIRWEVLIELGKAVLEHRDCPEKMNYTNLLKLVRINWLHEGYFPEHTRLELLKRLGMEEEIAARQRLIELFEYADVYFKDDHYFSTEKKMQEITNKFVVYANDPVRHETYLPAKEQFEAMWRNNKITDAPLKKYLDNTGKKKWDTPLQHNDKTISAGEYFKTEGSLNPPPPRLQKWNEALQFVTGLSFLLLIGLTFWGRDLAETGVANFLRINTVDSFRTVPVTLTYGTHGYCLSNFTDSLPFDELQFTLRDNKGEIIKEKDTSQGKIVYDVYYADLAKPLLVEASWRVSPPSRMINNRSYTGSASSAFLFTTDAIKLRISGCDNDLYPPITIRHSYSSPGYEQAKTLSQNLAASGYKNVRTVTAPTGDSILVQYSDANYEVEARRLADTVARYINYPVRTELVSDSLKKGFTILLPERNVTPSTACMDMPIEKLPGNLTDIWKGRTSNRLITIDLKNRYIWYSTGNKTSYGTYRIVEVCDLNGRYRIIASAGNQHKVFFVRNVALRQFELSVCPDFQNSLEEARTRTDGDCNNYDVMGISYEVAATGTGASRRFYYPYDDRNFTNELDATQSSLMFQFTNRLAGQFDGFEGSFGINLFFRRNYTDETSRTRLGLLRFGSVSPATKLTTTFNGTPFDRDYIEVTAVVDSVASGVDRKWNANELSAGCGKLDNDTWVVDAGYDCGNTPISYVAAMTLPSNRYVATWEVQIANVPSSDSVLASIQVINVNTGKMVTTVDLYGKDFLVRNPFPAHTFSFNITRDLANDRIELRILKRASVSIRTRKVTLISSPLRGDQ